MEKENSKKHRFGLVGRDISYSFSRGYFTEKFLKLALPAYTYENFDLKTIDEFKTLIQNNKNLSGLNVTIPYKEVIIPYLDKLNPEAAKIGAVNTIKFTPQGLEGYNTDAHGFQRSIEPFLKKNHTKALILGTGGASKAIAYVFEKLGIASKFVSRNPLEDQLSYEDLDKSIIENYPILVNCTPLGTVPNVERKPDIPYHLITEKQLLFDLIYNPAKTAFLLEGEKRNATICNGHRMLELQAEKSWEIWNSK